MVSEREVSSYMKASRPTSLAAEVTEIVVFFRMLKVGGRCTSSRTSAGSEHALGAVLGESAWLWPWDQEEASCQQRSRVAGTGMATLDMQPVSVLTVLWRWVSLGAK